MDEAATTGAGAATAAGATGVADGSVSPVVRTAPVQAVSGRSDGVLATSATAVQVVIGVDADDAADVLAAIAGRPLVVVVHESVDADAEGHRGASFVRQHHAASAAGERLAAVIARAHAFGHIRRARRR